MSVHRAQYLMLTPFPKFCCVYRGSAGRAHALGPFHAEFRCYRSCPDVTVNAASVSVDANSPLLRGVVFLDCVGGEWGGGPLAWAATCAQDAVGLSLLKFVLFGGAVFSPTEFLMMVMSACMLCVHLTAAWTC